MSKRKDTFLLVSIFLCAACETVLAKLTNGIIILAFHAVSASAAYILNKISAHCNTKDKGALSKIFEIFSYIFGSLCLPLTVVWRGFNYLTDRHCHLGIFIILGSFLSVVSVIFYTEVYSTVLILISVGCLIVSGIFYSIYRRNESNAMLIISAVFAVLSLPLSIVAIIFLQGFFVIQEKYQR